MTRRFQNSISTYKGPGEEEVEEKQRTTGGEVGLPFNLDMTKPQAKIWLKQNWNQLAFSGKLGEAVTRYLSLKDSPIIEEKSATAEVFVSTPSNDKKIADFFGSPLD